MSWDPFQRQVLAELGHAVYVARGAPAQPAAVEPELPVDAAALQALPLLARLARAAGVSPAQLLRIAPDVAAHAAGMDAAAKRALWPRLRMLRTAMLQRPTQ